MRREAADAMRVSEIGERIGVKMAKRGTLLHLQEPTCKKLMDA